ncbi:hypothetical protein [Paraburkholderia hospita]|uniref:hypothetical protein n=1 Tax=Paraburkholderia hospita TaxID=169430 RepID=UPI001F60879C|nr:hypothetical protein [Paraburkholderia hospita]
MLDKANRGHTRAALEQPGEVETPHVHDARKFVESDRPVEIFLDVFGNARNFHSGQRGMFPWNDRFECVVASKQMRRQRKGHVIDYQRLCGMRLAVEFPDENSRDVFDDRVSRLEHISDFYPRRTLASNLLAGRCNERSGNTQSRSRKHSPPKANRTRPA